MSRTMKQALIVEDDQDVARELSSLLNDMGFKVTTLDDATLAAEKLSTHQFEVALVNKTLPEESWQATLTAVKSASRSTTVIMMSRYANEEDIRIALSSGAYIVLDRPIDQARMTSLLASPKNDGLFVSLRE